MTKKTTMKRSALPVLAGLLALATLAGLPARAHAEAGAGAPHCTYVDIADLPIRYTGLSLDPAVEGTINGTPALMLADTGSDQTLLTMNAATRRDLSLSMTGRYIEGIGGSARLYYTRLKDFSVGPARSARRTELNVIGTTGFTPAFDAIVGAPFLLQADLEFDLRAKLARFYRPKDCDATPLMLWKEATVVLPFARSASRSPNPHFTVLVNGKELDAMIDTGAHHTTLTLDGAKRAGIDVNAPGARRAGEVAGIGSEHAPHWIVPVKRIALGDETITDATLGVIDARGADAADLYLGRDFLRTHRVLFAMSQKKLYVAYLGGDAFEQVDGVEPWMRAEADAGNADAQFTLANAYIKGLGVARDPAQGRAWLAKAAVGGQPNASLLLGRQQMLAGHVPEAIPKLRAALDQLPAERFGPLWLYIARLRNGEAALAKTELQASLKAQKEDDWPRPIADFYLGELDAAHLLDEAGKDAKAAHARSCMADAYMAEWHAAQGDKAHADTLMASVRAHCAPPAPAPAAAP
jgi:predicted aspartyl protease